MSFSVTVGMTGMGMLANVKHEITKTSGYAPSTQA